MNDGTIEIYPCYEAELDKRMKKLNRKADRIGVGEVRLVKNLVTKEKKKYDPVEKKWIPFSYQMIQVSVEGEPVKVAGYEFIAKVEFSDGFPYIASAPGKEAPLWARETDPSRCDHCSTRRYRNSVFILSEEATGEYIQVGRTCLKDFLGHDAKQIVSLFSFYRELEGLASENNNGWGCGLSWERSADTLELLAVTSLLIRKEGWVPKSAASEKADSTASQVATYLYPAASDGDYDAKWIAKWIAKIGTPEPVDQSVALKTIAYLDEIAKKARLSDYEHNLVSLRGLERIASRRFGIFISSVASYHRHIDKLESIRRQREATAQSLYIGELGDRQDFDLTIRSLKYLEGQYGMTTLISFSDQAGNSVKWFASGAKTYEVGERFVVTGTVKTHGEYQGTKETTITRCKLELIAAAA